MTPDLDLIKQAEQECARFGNPGNPGPSWHAKGAGDFNGDGRADILFQNDSGEVDIWELKLNGTSVIGSASLGNPGPTWHI